MKKLFVIATLLLISVSSAISTYQTATFTTSYGSRSGHGHEPENSIN